MNFHISKESHSFNNIIKFIIFYEFLQSNYKNIKRKMLTKNIILLLAINFAIFESRPFPTAEFDNNSKLEKVLLQQKKASTTTGDVEYAYEAELDNLLLLTTTSTTTTVTQKQLSESSSSTSTVTVVPPAQVDYEYEFGPVDKKTSNNNSFDWTWLIVLGVCLGVVVFICIIIVSIYFILRCNYKLKPKKSNRISNFLRNRILNFRNIFNKSANFESTNIEMI